MPTTEELIQQLRDNWSTLSSSKCRGTVAIVDLTGSTHFKAAFPSDIWMERLSSFTTTVRIVAQDVLGEPFIKYLGDGVLVFAKDDQVDPVKFVEFAKTLAAKIRLLNEADSSRYASEALSLQFTLAIDYGSDIYILFGGDPQGGVIDRVFRISSFLVPNMIGISAQFHQFLRATDWSEEFTLAGKASLKGISAIWQEIYALRTVDGFSTTLSPEQKKKEALIDIWEMGRDDKPIWVVSGAIRTEDKSDGEISTVQHGDSDALIEIIHILSKLYPERQIEIVTSEEYLERNRSSFNNDIISVSGPYYNLVSRRLINRMKLPIHFELDPKNLNEYEDPILSYFGPNSNKSEFKTERQGLRIISDVAVFIKANNTLTTDARFLYLVMGNQTQGTCGAARMFGISSPYLQDNREYVAEKLREMDREDRGFGIITRVPLVNDYTEPIELGTANDSMLFTLPLDYKLNSVQEGPNEFE